VDRYSFYYLIELYTCRAIIPLQRRSRTTPPIYLDEIHTHWRGCGSSMNVVQMIEKKTFIFYHTGICFMYF